jgi:hypothetical protein
MHHNPRWKLRALQRMVFESGFTGLIITSLVCVGRLLLYGAFIARPFADVLHIDEKKGINNPLQINIIPKTKTFSTIL